MNDNIDIATINNHIYMIRNQQVMLDFDLASLYGYTVKRMNEQVKRNIERFPDDFMFQLDMSEIPEQLKSQFATLNKQDNYRGMHIKKAPFAFTEQGIYMLASVLKSLLAIQQSIIIIRLFKEMRHYIIENQTLLDNWELSLLRYRVDKNEQNISDMMNNFLIEDKMKEFVILEGQKFEADEAYIKIYGQAKKSIYVVDNYINIHTLSHLKCKNKDVEVIIFSDNLGNGKSKLRQKEVTDFNKQYPTLQIKRNLISHDRYIVVDYMSNNEMIYHCGTSSMDAGRKLCGINRVSDTHLLHSSIDSLLRNKNLVL